MDEALATGNRKTVNLYHQSCVWVNLSVPLFAVCCLQMKSDAKPPQSEGEELETTKFHFASLHFRLLLSSAKCTPRMNWKLKNLWWCTSNTNNNGSLFVLRSPPTTSHRRQHLHSNPPHPQSLFSLVFLMSLFIPKRECAKKIVARKPRRQKHKVATQPASREPGWEMSE